MTAPPTSIASDIDVPAIVSDVRDVLAEATVTVNTIIDGANAFLQTVPTIGTIGVRDSLAQLQQGFNDALRTVGDVLAYAGDPATLRAAGSIWANQIGAAATELAGLASLNGISADDHWTGAAADAYRNTLPAQSGALNTIKTIGDEIDAALNELANAITIFWVRVLEAAIGLVGGLATAALTAAGGITIPVAIFAAIAAVGLFVDGLTAAIDAITDISTGSETRAAELERRLSNNSAFPGRTWPQSTNSVLAAADGSITDGDDTDWHVR